MAVYLNRSPSLGSAGEHQLDVLLCLSIHSVKGHHLQHLPEEWSPSYLVPEDRIVLLIPVHHSSQKTVSLKQFPLSDRYEKTLEAFLDYHTPIQLCLRPCYHHQSLEACPLRSQISCFSVESVMVMSQ